MSPRDGLKPLIVDVTVEDLGKRLSRFAESLNALIKLRRVVSPRALSSYQPQAIKMQNGCGVN